MFAKKLIGLAGLVTMIAVFVIPAHIIEAKGRDHLLSLIPAQQKPCPGQVDAFLVLGQSQGANTGEARTIAKTDTAWSFLGGKCWHLQDPIKGPPENGGSIWPRFADAYGRPVLIADMAISGSSIKQWTGPAQIEKVQTTLADMRKAGYEPTIIWLNGETDAAGKMSAEDYYRHMRTLSDALPGLRWLITIESRCYDMQEHYQPLDQARHRFVQDEPARRRIGGNLDAVSVEYRVSDRCHLNRRGQERFGRELAMTALQQ